jgi:hypothetical protein
LLVVLVVVFQHLLVDLLPQVVVELPGILLQREMVAQLQTWRLTLGLVASVAVVVVQPLVSPVVMEPKAKAGVVVVVLVVPATLDFKAVQVEPEVMAS